MRKKHRATRLTYACGIRRLVLTSCLVVFGCQAVAIAQNPEKAELITQETQPSFKVQVQRNLVLVHAVVRDRKGKAILNLHQQDFRLLDNGKPQAISYFSMEAPAPAAPPAAKPEPRVLASEANPDTSTVPFTPLRYLGLFFDDVHADFDGLARTRDAAEKYLAASTQSGDRIGVITSSGQGVADFTDDRSKIHDALFRLRPRPIAVAESNPCPDVFPYQAYLIVDRREQHALEEVSEEILSCRYNGDRRYYSTAQSEAEGEAVRVLTRDLNQTQYTFRGLEQLVRRMAALPGQRNIVMISPGFFTETEKQAIEEVVDRALRAKLTISALDSKGLFAYAPLADATRRAIVIPERPDLTGKKAQDQIDSFRFDEDVMAQLAGETGGVFFTNSNDMDEGFRKVGALPEVAYVLGFSPLNLKFDGRFHTLKVSLYPGRDLMVQARHLRFKSPPTSGRSFQAAMGL